MTTQHTITEHEAVALAGVSARTLKRFQESGYLEVSTDAEGMKRYQRAQILEIFGAAESAAQQLASAEPTLESQRKHSSSAETASTYSSRAYAAPQSADPEGADSGTRDHSASGEIGRLKNLISLQEKILDMKDVEIADLRSQRDWLRSRIERLEEKSERDQILLLSETQTIRKLVSYHESRRTPLQNILEWLGIAKQPELRALGAPDLVNGDTVEVKSAAANS